MKFLALETSTVQTVVVAADEKKLLAGVVARLEKGRGERVPGMITACLKKAKLKLSDIDAFAVGVGPGSFTGLRVGLSFIKGLSYSLGKPVIPFSSLNAIAWSQPLKINRRLAVAVDARRGNVYSCFYEGGRGVAKPAMLTAAAFVKKLKPGMLLAGDAVLVYGDTLFKKKKGLVICPEKLWYPTAQSVAMAARLAWAEKKVTDSFGLEAVYFYGPDCQVKKDAR